MCFGFVGSAAKLRASPPAGPTGSQGAVCDAFAVVSNARGRTRRAERRNAVCFMFPLFCRKVWTISGLYKHTPSRQVKRADRWIGQPFSVVESLPGNYWAGAA